MEITLKKVANGYVIRVEIDEDEVDFVDETYVFPKYSQALKFLKERFANAV